MSSERKRDMSHRPGGFDRSQRRMREYQDASRRADQEVEMFHIGEPTSSFYPPQEESDTFGHVVFDASSKGTEKGRKGDLAKRRRVLINSVLEEPQTFLPTEVNLSFIERHFPRIVKFAKTLRNKGKLHPEMERLLEI